MEDFDGETYNRALDRHRLTCQFRKVLEIMKDGNWRTLSEIATQTGGSEASISARLRDFRKDKFGGHTVERRRRGAEKKGLFEYKLTLRNN